MIISVELYRNVLKYLLVSLSVLLNSLNLCGQTLLDTSRIDYSHQNTSIANIMKELSDKYRVQFSYASDAILAQKRQVNYRSVLLKDVLDDLFRDQHIEYICVDNNILLRKSEGYTLEKDDRYKSQHHVRGKVYNHRNEALSYAAIQVEGTSYGTYTDDEGYFDLEIPDDYLEGILLIQYLGYDELRYRIERTKQEIVLLQLNEAAMSIDEIILVNQEKNIRISEQGYLVALNGGASGAMNFATQDVSRQIQMLPGIAAFDDSSAEIKIRGSAGDETLMILDGLPVYNPTHMYGIFSSVNPLYAQEAQVYKNNYPVQYGGRTGGLVTVSSERKKSATEVNLEMDLISAQAGAFIKLTDKLNVTIGGRSTYTDVSNSEYYVLSSRLDEVSEVDDVSNFNGNTPSDPSFKFYDINASLRWNLSDQNEISIHYFRSKDDYNLQVERGIQDRRDGSLNISTSENEDWAYSAIGVQHTLKLSPTLSLKNFVHRSTYDHKGFINYSIASRVRGRANQNRSLGLDFNDAIDDKGFNTFLESQGDRDVWRVGAQLNRFSADYRITENRNQLIGGKNSSNAYSLYGSYEKTISNVDVSIGLRNTYHAGLKKWLFSPRLSLIGSLNDNVKWKASYGYFNQFIRVLEYEYRGELQKIWLSADGDDIPVLYSHNFMLGSTWFTHGFTVDIEGYYRSKSGAMEYAVLEPGRDDGMDQNARDYQLFSGNGQVKGIDIMISKQIGKSDHYLSYTLSKSTESYAALARGEPLPSTDDRRHQLQWTSVIPVNKWTFSGTCLYVSGRPYTDLATLGDQGSILSADQETRFSYLPAYARLDLGVDYSFELGTFPCKMGLSVFNITDNKNVKYIQNVVSSFDENDRTKRSIIGNEVLLLGRLFNVSLNVTF